MLMPDFDRMLSVMLPSAQPTSLTLTEAPSQASQMTAILEHAIRSGNQRSTRLTRIQLPMGRFPDMGASFWHVPVEDSGKADVVRLFFEP